MNRPYYLQSASRHRGARAFRERPEPPRDYFDKALAALKADPRKLEIVRDNLRHYEQQAHLPKRVHRALKRFSYLLAVTDDPDEIARWVLQDSYEGNAFRQFPLIFKGLSSTQPEGPD